MQCHCRAPCQTNESSWPGRHAARLRAQALQGSNATLTKRTPGPKSWCEKPSVRSGYMYIYIYIYHVLICLSYFTPDWDDDPKGLIFLMVQTTNPEGTFVHEPVPRIYAFHKEENPCWTMSCTALCCQIHSHEETPLMPFVNLLKVCWDSGSLKRRIAQTCAPMKHTKTCDNIQKHMTTHENIWEQLKKWNVWKRLHVANDLMTFQNRLPYQLLLSLPCGSEKITSCRKGSRGLSVVSIHQPQWLGWVFARVAG